MFIKEAEWLRARLAEIRDEDLFPLLDVGSQTLQFRMVQQPHVDQELFSPLRERGGRIIHLDLQDAEGVDVVGNLTDSEFQESLRSLGVRSIIISNLLEHVRHRASVAEASLRVVKSGGYVIVTGPKDYPYHPDPIDTMFRPTGRAALDR